jgi:isoleucyl-tRNA synthetase
MRYSAEWEDVVNRFGRWIDFKNDYKTLDLNFMESVWHVFKTLFNKGLVYRGRKIMPYSNAVHTVLSNFEVQLNYKEVNDPSLWINIPLANDPTTKFVVWTTTPWTLPSNLALAVNPDFDYVKIRDLKRN